MSEPIETDNITWICALCSFVNLGHRDYCTGCEALRTLADGN